MPRHAKHAAEALNLIGARPEPAELPPLYATDLDMEEDSGEDNGPDNRPDTEPDMEEAPGAERPEIYDYEPINMARANTREGPFNGSPVMISDDETTPGVLAMWYTTRKRIGYAWKPFTAWVDPITRVEISMKPKFWRANPRMGAFW